MSGEVLVSGARVSDSSISDLSAQIGLVFRIRLINCHILLEQWQKNWHMDSETGGYLEVR